MTDPRAMVQTMISLASASLGLVAALAWNEAIKALLAQLHLGDDCPGCLPMPLWQLSWPWSCWSCSASWQQRSAGMPPLSAKRKGNHSSPVLLPPDLMVFIGRETNRWLHRDRAGKCCWGLALR